MISKKYQYLRELVLLARNTQLYSFLHGGSTFKGLSDHIFLPSSAFFFSCKRKKINNKYLWKFQLLTLLSNSRNSASVSWFCARSSRTLVNFFRPTSRTTFFPQSDALEGVFFVYVGSFPCSVQSEVHFFLQSNLPVCSLLPPCRIECNSSTLSWFYILSSINYR